MNCRKMELMQTKIDGEVFDIDSTEGVMIEVNIIVSIFTMAMHSLLG